MANAEHVKILKQGVSEWNAWRVQLHSEIPPDLTHADLAETNLSGANLTGADLRWANLSGADLSGAHLSGAILSGAILIEADLSGADLKALLSGADLSRANLSETNLSGAHLRGANLSGANLTGADLSGADLVEADLRGAYLIEADLSGAHLSGAHLSRADLSGADLSNAHVVLTAFVHVDLSVAKGLETIKHLGPSSVGIDTIYMSAGKIPDVFLRGAGVPDNFITYIGSLVGKSIEFYSCFISYSTKDQEFADRLYADLQAKGVRCWFAPHHMAAGKKVHEQIDEAIRLHERLLLILSKASMESEWVKTEIAKARRREVKEKRRVLFPVGLVKFDSLREWECFDADTGKDSAREIREFFIPDFSQWKDHDFYQKAFERLLHDLKAEAKKDVT